MWPDHPLGVDLARIFEPDWCRRVPADALVLGKRCGAERILDGRRHRCRLDPAHQAEHVCWCGTLFAPDAAFPESTTSVGGWWITPWAGRRTSRDFAH
jgi:hypothetical protein